MDDEITRMTRAAGRVRYNHKLLPIITVDTVFIRHLAWQAFHLRTSSGGIVEEEGRVGSSSESGSGALRTIALDPPTYSRNQK